MDVLRTHPYFFANLPLMVVVLTLVRSSLSRESAKWAYASGLFCIPCCLLSVAHEIDYWSPVRLGGILPGLEDIMFCILAGMLSWLASAWSLGSRLEMSFRLATALRRYFIFGLLFSALFSVLHLCGMSSMTITVLLTAAGLVGLLILRRGLLILAISGSACFFPFYVAIVFVQFRVWPDYVMSWYPDGIWGQRVMGLPFGELVWAPAFAAFWPVFMAYVWEARVNEAGMSSVMGSKPGISGRFV